MDYAAALLSLDAVERRLNALPADAFGERHELLTERDRLRGRIRVLQGDRSLTDDRPTSEIQREIQSLRANAAALQKHRIDLVKQAGGGRTNEMGNQGGFQINRQMDEATGYNHIRQRIARLEAILEDRGTEPSGP